VINWLCVFRICRAARRDDFMYLEIDGMATADAGRRLVGSQSLPRSYDRNQAITALTVTELRRLTSTVGAISEDANLRAQPRHAQGLR